MGRPHAPQRLPGVQSGSRSLRRVPYAGRIVVACRRRGRRRQRGAGLRRTQARNAGNLEGDRRDRNERRRARAHRVRDRRADWRARRRGAWRGDPIRRRLAVRVAVADPDRALDRAERDRARRGVRPFDGVRVLDRAAGPSARRAGDDADPRSRRGASGLAPQALPRRRGARGSGARRACHLHEPATFGRDDGRGRDLGRFCGAEARRARHCLPRAPCAAVALRRMAHGAGRDPQARRADGVGRAVARLGPRGAGRAHARRREHARRVARSPSPA